MTGALFHVLPSFYWLNSINPITSRCQLHFYITLRLHVEGGETIAHEPMPQI